MTHTLIATVGRSPGAVTGLYHALAQGRPEARPHSGYPEPDFVKPIFPNHVVLLHTKNDAVLKSVSCIERELRREYPRHIQHFTKLDVGIDDIRHQRAAYAFQSLVTASVEQIITHPRFQETKQNILLGITGGRTSMGAMLSLTGHLFSDDVKHICNFWVHPTVERDGRGDIENVDSALNDPNRCDAVRAKVLFPSRELYQIVTLPKYDLALRRRDIKDKTALELEDDPDIGIYDVILEALPGRLSVAHARDLLNIITQLAEGDSTPGDYRESLEILFAGAGFLRPGLLVERAMETDWTGKLTDHEQLKKLFMDAHFLMNQEEFNSTKESDRLKFEYAVERVEQMCSNTARLLDAGTLVLNSATRFTVAGTSFAIAATSGAIQLIPNLVQLGIILQGFKIAVG